MKLPAFALLTFLVMGSLTLAQDYNLPSKSPRQKISQQFSISEIAVDYGRPSVKGREIFGKLVPFGKLWRLGANKATTFKAGQDVVFAGKKLTAGLYAMYAIPNKTNWTIVINKGTNNWGTYGYKDEVDVLRVDVPTSNLKNSVENMTIDFTTKGDDEATMHISWANTRVSIPIKVSNPEEVETFIRDFKKKKN